MLDKLRYQAYRATYRWGRHLPLKAPVDVSLELSSKCNMKCIYCYHASKDTPFKQNFMDEDLAYKIIDQAHELGVNSLKMNFRGESTMNPAFAKITHYAKYLAHGSTFIDRITNSNFKFRTDKDIIFEGLARQTLVKISYDSFSKDVFEKQRAGGDHDLTTRNIDKFYNWPGRTTKMIIQAVRTQNNKDEPIYQLAKERWPEAEISIRDVAPGRKEEDIEDLEVKERSVIRKPCLQAYVRMIVHWDGKVNACCPAIRNDLVIGDVTKQSLKDIFNGPIVKALRKDLKSGERFKYGPCQTCSSHESYAGFKPVWNS